jgi:hypothetical protein
MNGVLAVVYIAVIVFLIASMWKTFVKAGQAGWAAIIPIYNTLIQLRIIGRPWWWLLLLIIPIVNIVILFIVSIDMAKSFGKGTGFGVGLALLSFIFWPILGFGSAQYIGPRGEGSSPATAEPSAAW